MDMLSVRFFAKLDKIMRDKNCPCWECKFLSSCGKGFLCFDAIEVVLDQIEKGGDEDDRTGVPGISGLHRRAI